MLDICINWIKDNTFIFSIIGIGLASWPIFQKWKIQKSRRSATLHFQNIYQKIKKSPTGGDCLYWPEEDQYICPVCLYSEKRITPVFEDDQSGYYTCDHCHSRRVYNRITVELTRRLAEQHH